MAIKKVPDNPAKDLTFTKGEKEVFSLRLPKELIKAIEASSKEQGWAKSDFVQMILDQYLTQNGVQKK